LLKGELDYKKKAHLRNYTVRYSIDIVTVITKQSKQQIATQPTARCQRYKRITTTKNVNNTTITNLAIDFYSKI